VVQAERTAAEHADGQLAYDESAGHYERALQALDLDRAATEAIRLELLKDLAGAHARAGRTDDAARTLKSVVERARRAGLGAELASAAIALEGLGALYGWYDADREELLTEALASVGPGDSSARALLLASLARMRVHQRSRIDPLDSGVTATAEEAVAVARRVGDPAALAGALFALHDTMWIPGRASERLEVLAQMLDAARASGDARMMFHAHELRYAALLELGSRDAFSEFEAMAQLAERMHQPRVDFYIITRRASQEIMEGRLADAEQHAREAEALGQTIGEPDTPLVHACLMSEILAPRGRVLEMRSVLDAQPRQTTDQGHALFRVQLDIAEGNVAGARDVVHQLFDEVADFIAASVGASGGLFVAWLTRAIVGLDDTEAARRVYETALPLAGQHVVGGGGVIYVGSVSHHLGELARTFGDEDAAISHYEEALTLHDRLGARLWVAQTQAALGALLVDREPARSRELLAAARDAAEEIGMPPTLAAIEIALAHLAAGDRPGLHCHGTVWMLSWAGETAHVADCKGLQDLAILVGRPHELISVNELVAVDEAGAADVLDERARREYKQRLDDIAGELREAEAGNDLVRAERLRAERDALIDELARATGLLGRPRRLGDPGERARKAVSARIRDAINRVEAVHSRLGAHLRASVVTGSQCSYQPR
jgi:tetratricopeptide (TPR) repeat protein